MVRALSLGVSNSSLAHSYLLPSLLALQDDRAESLDSQVAGVRLAEDTECRATRESGYDKSSG